MNSKEIKQYRNRCKCLLPKFKVDRLIKLLLECEATANKSNRFRTASAINGAIKIAGWELADILTGEQKV
jgi:hypothetical protein